MGNPNLHKLHHKLTLAMRVLHGPRDVADFSIGMMGRWVVLKKPERQRQGHRMRHAHSRRQRMGLKGIGLTRMVGSAPAFAIIIPIVSVANKLMVERMCS